MRGERRGVGERWRENEREGGTRDRGRRIREGWVFTLFSFAFVVESERSLVAVEMLVIWERERERKKKKCSSSRLLIPRSFRRRRMHVVARMMNSLPLSCCFSLFSERSPLFKE